MLIFNTKVLITMVIFVFTWVNTKAVIHRLRVQDTKVNTW